MRFFCYTTLTNLHYTRKESEETYVHRQTGHKKRTSYLGHLLLLLLFARIMVLAVLVASVRRLTLHQYYHHYYEQ